MQKWEGSALVMHWELTDPAGVTYVSDIRTSLSADGKFSGWLSIIVSRG